MKHFIAKKDPISEHQRGNGINILVFKTRVKAAVFQGIQRLHQKKVHLLARYITGWRPRAKNELLKIMQLSNIFTMQYFALSILLKIISLKKHESSKQQYWRCTYILQTEKLSQRIHSIVRFLNIIITCKPMFCIFSAHSNFKSLKNKSSEFPKRIFLGMLRWLSSEDVLTHSPDTINDHSRSIWHFWLYVSNMKVFQFYSFFFF